MKLRNKKTGEIIILIDHIFDNYNSLDEFEQEWEDYEEPKEFWFIDEEGIIRSTKEENWPEESVVAAKSIGNYFETKEEAERAVEKLKAWKRMKDKGFQFEGIKEDWTRLGNPIMPVRDGRRYLQFNKAEDNEWLHENWEDLTILFGGEE